jgi:hypothetical protein
VKHCVHVEHRRTQSPLITDVGAYETNAILTFGQIRNVPMLQVVKSGNRPEIISNKPLNQVTTDETGSARDQNMRVSQFPS